MEALMIGTYVMKQQMAERTAVRSRYEGLSRRVWPGVLSLAGSAGAIGIATLTLNALSR